MPPPTTSPPLGGWVGGLVLTFCINSTGKGRLEFLLFLFYFWYLTAHQKFTCIMNMWHISC